MPFDTSTDFVRYGNGFVIQFGTDYVAENKLFCKLQTPLNQIHSVSILPMDVPEYDRSFSCDTEISNGSVLIETDQEYQESNNPSEENPSWERGRVNFSYILFGY